MISNGLVTHGGLRKRPRGSRGIASCSCISRIFSGSIIVATDRGGAVESGDRVWGRQGRATPGSHWNRLDPQRRSVRPGCRRCGRPASAPATGPGRHGQALGRVPATSLSSSGCVPRRSPLRHQPRSVGDSCRPHISSSRCPRTPANYQTECTTCRFR